MNDIYLNFIALTNQDFSFNVYRKEADVSQKKGESVAYRGSLPTESGSDDYDKKYDIRWKPDKDFEKYVCHSMDNVYLTNKYLYRALINKLTGEKKDINWYECQNDFINEVCFIVKTHEKGNTEIRLSPYYLKSGKCHGFIVNHCFKKKESVQFDREVQRLSLSLDKNYRPNRYFYSDKYHLLINLIEKYSDVLFPIGDEINVSRNFFPLRAASLNTKLYRVGKNQTANSQFVGVINNGPFKTIDGKYHYMFVFSESVRNLARDIYSGLTGKLFPGQFKGISEMFHLSFGKNNVSHYYVVKSFNKEELDKAAEEAIKYVSASAIDKVMVIAILPRGTRENREFDAYSYLKYLSIKNGFYSQCIEQETMDRKEQLKWSISNVALQIFCKLGGIPWLLKPSNDRCLIFGIGSAHEKNENGEIIKYMAYTVCLDTTGDFKHVKPLSISDEKETYLQNFTTKLIETLKKELVNGYDKCVIHIPFKIKKYELKKIKQAVRDIKKSSGIDILAVKVNKEHKYFGFSAHNTKVPYESSFIKLSGNEYLIWAEGLQYGKEKVNTRISEPLHIEFLYEKEERYRDDDRTFLQDILNLTGANWRGFNAKAQPISILYSTLIAKFMKDFRHLKGVEDLSIFSNETDTPWFL